MNEIMELYANCYEIEVDEAWERDQDAANQLAEDCDWEPVR